MTRISVKIQKSREEKRSENHQQEYKISELGQTGKINPAPEYLFDSCRKHALIQWTGGCLGLNVYIVRACLTNFDDFNF